MMIYNGHPRLCAGFCFGSGLLVEVATTALSKGSLM